MKTKWHFQARGQKCQQKASSCTTTFKMDFEKRQRQDLPEAFLLFLLLFVALPPLFSSGGGLESVSSSFRKGLLLNTFFSELLVGGLGALDFFIDDFLLLDLAAGVVLAAAQRCDFI